MRKLVAMCAVLALAHVAAAQPRTPTPDQRQRAADLVKQAIAKSQAGDHAAAIELYLQAYGIVPLPILLSNVGSEYKSSDKPVEALRYFCKYLEADPTGTNVSYATSEAKVLQIQLGNTTVDDKTVCAPAKPVEKPVEQPVEKPVEKPIEQPVEKPVPAAAHPGAALEITGIVVGGLGLVGLGAGIYFGAQAQSISNEITNHDPTQPWPTDIAAREKQGQTDENRQILFLAVGGGAVATGVLLYVLGHAKNSDAESAHKVVVAPLATRDAYGLAIGGRF